jgi:hypothetical protein
VRPVVVVVVLPSRGQLPCCGDGLKLFKIQELVSQSAVEALGVAVLPRGARRDVQRLDADVL